LIIIIAGTGCMGKSFLATQLAERINVPNVLQTNLVYEFLNSVKYTTPHTPLILTLTPAHRSRAGVPPHDRAST
jgi:2-phosphoglycerate kinase